MDCSVTQERLGSIKMFWGLDYNRISSNNDLLQLLYSFFPCHCQCQCFVLHVTTIHEDHQFLGLSLAYTLQKREQVDISHSKTIDLTKYTLDTTNIYLRIKKKIELQIAQMVVSWDLFLVLLKNVDRSFNWHFNVGR